MALKRVMEQLFEVNQANISLLFRLMVACPIIANERSAETHSSRLTWCFTAICYLVLIAPMRVRARCVPCSYLGVTTPGYRSSAVSEVRVSRNGYVQYQYQGSADIKLDKEVELKYVSLVTLFSLAHMLKPIRRLSSDRDTGVFGDYQPIDSPDTRSYLFASATSHLNLSAPKDTSRISWNQVGLCLCWVTITIKRMQYS